MNKGHHTNGEKHEDFDADAGNARARRLDGTVSYKKTLMASGLSELRSADMAEVSLRSGTGHHQCQKIRPGHQFMNINDDLCIY